MQKNSSIMSRTHGKMLKKNTRNIFPHWMKGMSTLRMKNVEEKHEEYISALDEGNVDLENEKC